MVSVVEGIREGGRILPENVDTAVRSSVFGQTAVALGETAASGARVIGGQDETPEVTFGSSPLGSGRYDLGTGETELPGSGGGTGTPLSQLAGQIIRNLPAIVGGVVVLAVIVALGNLLTFNFNIGDSTS